MSGGSYEYLCWKDANEILGDYSAQHNLDRMVTTLAELGYAQDAAQESMHLLMEIRAATVRLQVRVDRLKDLWHAVEWWEDLDMSEDQVKVALAKYRGESVEAVS